MQICTIKNLLDVDCTAIYYGDLDRLLTKDDLEKIFSNFPEYTLTTIVR